MDLRRIASVLEADVICGRDYLDIEIPVAYASDLMSDVLAFATAGSLLLTGLTNPQVVRTAEMADIAAVCFVNGKRPQQDTISLAKGRRIPLLATRLFMYGCCGRLHVKGLAGGNDSGSI